MSKERTVLYWPVASYRDKDNQTKVLFTYDSFLSEDKARDQFGIWANHYDYHLLSAVITIETVYDDGSRHKQTKKVF